MGTGGESFHPTLRAMTRTATEIAAFKAQNLAQCPAVHVITRTAQPARQSQRQEWQEFRAETLGMIEAAKREGHLQILPQLMQRLTTADTMLANQAFN